MIFLLKLVSSMSLAWSAPQKMILAEVKFNKEKSSHEYVLTQTMGAKPEYELKFMDERKRMAVKAITDIQAKRIQSDLANLIWEKQYRTPASSKNCHGYLNLKLTKDKATICLENTKQIGKAFGVLNGLNAIYK